MLAVRDSGRQASVGWTVRISSSEANCRGNIAAACDDQSFILSSRIMNLRRRKVLSLQLHCFEHVILPAFATPVWVPLIPR
jgi:hypothetical protein